MIQELTEVGELDDGEAVFFKRGMRVGGYRYGDDGRRLDLIAPIYTQTTSPQTVTRDQADTCFCAAVFPSNGREVS